MSTPTFSPRSGFASIRRSWRGLLLAIAAVAALPSYALTITQTASFATSGFGQGSGLAASGGTWTAINPFDVAGATLESVRFEAHVTGSVTATDLNFLPVDLPLNPYASLESMFIYINPGSGYTFTFGTLFDTKNDPQVLLTPGQAYSIQGDFEQHLDLTITNAGLLAALSSGEPNSILFSHRGYGSSFAGGKSMSTESTLTLTYTYGVPDSGGTLLLLGVAFAILGLGCGRGPRRPAPHL